MNVRLVGLDCATEEAKIGVSFGVFENGKLSIVRAIQCTRQSSARATISTWIKEGEGPVLLAIDAPLGWPRPLARALASHRAGEAIETPPNEMFRRATDRFIQENVGKTPLDVGADRIARTAHAALRILGELRRDLSLSIPLAWDCEYMAPVAAIEVYPAATLLGHGLQASGYKKAGQVSEREDMIRGLGALVALPADLSAMRTSADALDAVVCLLAARDFLLGQAAPPRDRPLAEVEGWIWVKLRTDVTDPAKSAA